LQFEGRIDNVTSDKAEDKGDYNIHSKITFTARVSKFMTGDIFSRKNLQGLNKKKERERKLLTIYV